MVTYRIEDGRQYGIEGSVFVSTNASGEEIMVSPAKTHKVGKVYDNSK